MTTNTRSKSTPKDKFYRRYAAAFVLGIVVADVPKHSWKDLFPRIYGEDGKGKDAELLERFRSAKGTIKGLSGAQVIEMVTQAQSAESIAPAKAGVTITEVEHENSPTPPAKAPAKKPAAKKLGAKVKASASNDLDAIKALYGKK